MCPVVIYCLKILGKDILIGIKSTRFYLYRNNFLSYMKYQIVNVERELDGNDNINLSNVKLSFDPNFDIVINKEGDLRFKNNHYRTVPDMLPYYLKLNVDDLPVLEDIFDHWQTIRNDFVNIKSSGNFGAGWFSTSFYFPDGTEAEYTREEHEKNNSIKPFKFKRIEGISIDDRFSSSGCKYINDFPYLQHYSHGRFNFQLEHDSITIDDAIENDNGRLGQFEEILDNEQPKIILELLRFIKSNPYNVLERLIGSE